MQLRPPRSAFAVTWRQTTVPNSTASLHGTRFLPWPLIDSIELASTATVNREALELHLQAPVIVNVALFPESIHERVDVAAPGSRQPAKVSCDILANNRLGLFVLAIVGQQQKRTRQTVSRCAGRLV